MICPLCRKPVDRNDVNSTVLGTTVIHNVCIMYLRKRRRERYYDHEDPWEGDNK